MFNYELILIISPFTEHFQDFVIGSHFDFNILAVDDRLTLVKHKFVVQHVLWRLAKYLKQIPIHFAKKGILVSQGKSRLLPIAMFWYYLVHFRLKSSVLGSTSIPKLFSRHFEQLPLSEMPVEC